MGNTSSVEFDNECYNILTIDGIEFIIDFYVAKRWFNIKLTNNYDIKIYEIINNKLLDIKYFDFNITDNNQLNLIYKLTTTNIKINETILIDKIDISNFRRTQIEDIQLQLDTIASLININIMPFRQDICDYKSILDFFNSHYSNTSSNTSSIVETE